MSDLRILQPTHARAIAARWSEIDDLSDAKQATFNLR